MTVKREKTKKETCLVELSAVGPGGSGGLDRIGSVGSQAVFSGSGEGLL